MLDVWKNGFVARIITLLLCLGLSLSILISLSTVAAAATYKDIGNATITDTQTWTPEGGPYVINNLTISSTGCLDIQPGTVIKLRSGGGITINGTLNINGVSNNLVVFTSIKDDSVGDDTDQATATPSNSDWGNIVINTGGKVVCKYGKFSYGGYKYENWNYVTNLFLINTGGSMEITDSIIDNYYSTAINNSGVLKLERTTISHGYYGITSSTNITADSCVFSNLSSSGTAVQGSGIVNILNCTISGCYTAVNATGTLNITNNNMSGCHNGISCCGNITIQNNTITDCLYPVSFSDMGSNTAFNWSGNTLTGMTYKGFYISTLGSKSCTLSKMDLPYYSNSLTVNTGKEMTIEAGVILKFMSGGITVNGTLNINGTSADPVRFTSIKDDSVGDDTDQATAKPSNSDWGNIVINTGGKVVCKYGKFSYGGYKYENWNYVTNLFLINTGGSMEITDSIIDNYYSTAINNSGVLKLERTTISHGYYGITSSTSITADSCVFSNLSSSGTAVQGTGIVNILNCTISGCYTAVNATGTLNITNNNMSGCHNGINCCGDITIQNNTITDCLYPVSFSDMGSNTAFNWSGNTLTGMTYKGFYISTLGSKSCTLSKMDLPYYSNSLTVNTGKEMTIEAGVILKFMSGGITVNGTLNINGTSADPVRFTSIKDDSVGDDTDQATAKPSNSDWGNIVINTVGKVVCKYGKFSYGGYSYSNGSSNSNQFLINTGGSMEITDSIIDNYYSTAINNSGVLNIERTTISHGSSGIVSSTNITVDSCVFSDLNPSGTAVQGSGIVNILNCTISGCYTAVNATGTLNITNNNMTGCNTGISCSGDITIQDNTFTNCLYAVSFSDMGNNTAFNWSGNTLTGTTYKGFYIYSIGSKSCTLSKMDLPYYSNSLTVNTGKEMTIEAGVILKFMSGGITVNGTLNINGTSADPVMFTSIKDDSIGGDTDGGSSMPESHDYGNHYVNAGGKLVCKYGMFYYGGYASSWTSSNYNLFTINAQGSAEFTNSHMDLFYDTAILNSGKLTVDRTTISNGGTAITIMGGEEASITFSNFLHNRNYGIIFNSSSFLPTIKNCQFIGNQIAVKNYNSKAIDCTWNYWNHEKGPSTYQSTSNSWTSFGEKVDGAITYNPFYKSKITGATTPSVIGLTDGDKINKDPIIEIQDGIITSIAVDGTAWENGVPLSEGEHTLKVNAKNFKQEVQIVISFKLDKTPPTAVIDNGSNIKIATNTPVSFSASKSGDNFGIISYVWSISSGESYSGSSFSKTFVQAGNYSLILKVTDDCGNETSTDAQIVVGENNVPANFKATATNTSVTLTWERVNEATGYQIMVDGNTIEVGNISSYIQENLVPGTKHVYQIRALIGGVAGPWSALINAITPLRIPVVVNTTTYNSVTLHWSDITGATRYDVEVEGSQVIDNGILTSFTEENLKAYTQHSYRVRAKNSIVTGEWSPAIICYSNSPYIHIDATCISSIGAAPLTANFAYSATSDKGTVNYYEWDFDGDGICDWSYTIPYSASHTYTKSGTYHATLKVIDNKGNIGVKVIPITVTSQSQVNVTYNPTGGGVPLSVVFNANATTTSEATISKYEWDYNGDGLFEWSGQSQNNVILKQDGESELGAWTSTGGWSISANGYVSEHCLTDSPDGNYANNVNAILLSPVIDLTQGGNWMLAFEHRYSVESNYDFCIIEVSTDNGVTWNLLKQYTGLTTDWTAETLNLGGYSGKKIQIRFRLVSDFETSSEGWSIDDIVITTNGCSTTYTYTKPGVYKPLLKVTDNQGTSITWTGLINIGVNDAPVIDKVIADKMQGPGPLTVNFTVNASGKNGLIALYQWDFNGDGIDDWTSETTGSTTYTFETPGTYYAHLKVTDQNGLTSECTMPIKVDLVIKLLPLQESFNPEAEQVMNIGYNINGDADMSVDITDIHGEIVRNIIVEKSQTKGDNQVIWDGSNSTGSVMPEGVYYVVLKGKIADGREFVLNLTSPGQQVGQAIQTNSLISPLQNQFGVINWYQNKRGLLSLFFGYGMSNTDVIRTIFTKKPYVSGNHTYFWDGTNDDGTPCSLPAYWPSFNLETISDNGFILQVNRPLIVGMAANPNYFYVGNSFYSETPGPNMLSIAANFDLPCCVKVTIRNSTGVIVRTMSDTNYSSGHLLLWDGTTDNGDFVLNGLYTAEIMGISAEGHESEPGRVTVQVCN